MVLTAFDTGSRVDDAVRDAIAAAILEGLPAVVDVIANAQAKTNFAGTYVSTATNSSLTIDVNSNGLVVTAWVNEGVDIFKEILAQVVKPGGIDYRIVPNGLYEGDQVGFTSFYQNTVAVPSPLLDCLGWLLVDWLTLGNIPLVRSQRVQAFELFEICANLCTLRNIQGQMVFKIDGSGKAIEVNLRGLRTTLQRKA